MNRSREVGPPPPLRSSAAAAACRLPTSSTSDRTWDSSSQHSASLLVAFLRAFRAPTRPESAAAPPIASRVKWESSNAQAQPTAASVRVGGRPRIAREAFFLSLKAPAVASRVLPSVRRRVRTWGKREGGRRAWRRFEFS